MVQSDKASVNQYIATLNDDDKVALKELRYLILKTFPNYKESMLYKMPTYSFDKHYIAFARQKNYISLYLPVHHLVTEYTSKFNKVSSGKSCLRFQKITKDDLPIIEELLQEVRNQL